MPIRDEGTVSRVALFSAPMADVQDNVALIRRQILIAGALGLLLALAGGFVVSRSMVRRVRGLEHGAGQVAAGDFTTVFPTAKSDELGQLARALDDMQRQLAQVESARRRFIATASHELRTPIFSIGGFLELMEDEELDDETRRQFVATVREQVERLGKLATDLLDLSRLEAGSFELRLEPTDLGVLTRAVTAEFAPALDKHDSPLDVTLGEQIETVCDPERVAQILRILIDNALTHTPSGTRVGRHGGARQRRRAARRQRRRTGDQRGRRRARLRAVLHVRRRAGIGARAGDRARARRAHGGLARRPRGTRAHDVLIGATGLRRAVLLAASLAALASRGLRRVGQRRRRGERPARATQTAIGVTTVEERTTTVEVVRGDAGDDAFDPARIYERDAPGVVTVVSVLGGDGAAQGLGSGFVLNGRGEIATNAHVVTDGRGRAIRKAKEVYVAFADGNQVPARIVGFDPNADVALLRIDPRGLTLRPLRLGTARDLRVGSPVAAIGSPFGEPQSLSVGVVSATDRSIKSLTGFDVAGAIQTDAAINRGNSGGPLVNAKGDVLGINSQIQTTSGGGEGVGYAVPADTVRRTLAALRKDGRVEYAYLGVSTARIYPQLAQRFKLPVTTGAWVQDVVSGGPGRQGRRARRGRHEALPGARHPGRRRHHHSRQRREARRRRGAWRRAARVQAGPGDHAARLPVGQAARCSGTCSVRDRRRATARCVPRALSRQGATDRRLESSSRWPQDRGAPPNRTHRLYSSPIAAP